AHLPLAIESCDRDAQADNPLQLRFDEISRGVRHGPAIASACTHKMEWRDLLTDVRLAPESLWLPMGKRRSVNSLRHAEIRSRSALKQTQFLIFFDETRPASIKVLMYPVTVG